MTSKRSGLVLRILSWLRDHARTIRETPSGTKLKKPGGLMITGKFGAFTDLFSWTRRDRGKGGDSMGNP